MKLQLTPQALERLIGGDTELELDLRKAAAKAFGNKYMKDMLQTAVSEAISSMRHDIDNIVSEEIRSQIQQKEPRFRASIYIDEYARDSIRKQIKTIIDEVFRETILNLIKAQAKELRL